jgi:hypothetical protein
MSNEGKISRGWIGVDLDGTLAHYDDNTYDGTFIGAPIPKMLERVKQWVANGWEVRIVTARVAPCHNRDIKVGILNIQGWLISNGLPPLEVTCTKDHGMIELWDDRAVGVIPNTGERADGKV